MANDMETEQSERVWGGIATGAAIGFLVGGALALLFAPKAGNQLRADLGNAVEDLKDKAEQVIDELQENSTDWSSRSREIIEQTRENLVRSVEAGKEAYLHKRDELSTQLDG